MNLTLLKTRLKSEPGWVICGCTAMWRATGAIPSLGRVGGCRKALTSERLKKKQGHTANHASPNANLAQSKHELPKGENYVLAPYRLGWETCMPGKRNLPAPPLCSTQRFREIRCDKWLVFFVLVFRCHWSRWAGNYSLCCCCYYYYLAVIPLSSFPGGRHD